MIFFPLAWSHWRNTQISNWACWWELSKSSNCYGFSSSERVYWSFWYFFFTGATVQFFNLNIDWNHFRLFIGFIRWRSLFLIICFIFLLFHCFSGEFHPCLEGNLKVHYSKEWVDTVFFLDDTVENVLIRKLHVLVLNAQCNQVNSILGFKLENLHLFVDLHVTVFSPHASIQELIEIDIPIITLDCHLKKLLLKLSIFKVMFTETERLFLISLFS